MDEYPFAENRETGQPSILLLTREITYTLM